MIDSTDTDGMIDHLTFAEFRRAFIVKRHIPQSVAVHQIAE